MHTSIHTPPPPPGHEHGGMLTGTEKTDPETGDSEWTGTGDYTKAKICVTGPMMINPPAPSDGGAGGATSAEESSAPTAAVAQNDNPSSSTAEVASTTAEVGPSTAAVKPTKKRAHDDEDAGEDEEEERPRPAPNAESFTRVINIDKIKIPRDQISAVPLELVLPPPIEQPPPFAFPFDGPPPPPLFPLLSDDESMAFANFVESELSTARANSGAGESPPSTAQPPNSLPASYSPSYVPSPPEDSFGEIDYPSFESTSQDTTSGECRWVSYSTNEEPLSQNESSEWESIPVLQAVHEDTPPPRYSGLELTPLEPHPPQSPPQSPPHQPPPQFGPHAEQPIYWRADVTQLSQSGAPITLVPSDVESPTVMTPHGMYVVCDVHEPLFAVHKGGAIAPQANVGGDADLAVERARYWHSYQQREIPFSSEASL